MADTQNPVEAYEQLDQSQRTQIARSFLDEMKKENHASYEKYEHVDLNTVTAAQLADMHDHAAKNHPAVIGVVMEHPVITAALAGFAVYQLDKHLGKR